MEKQSVYITDIWYNMVLATDYNDESEPTKRRSSII